MAQSNIDLTDVVPIILFPAMASFVLGVFSFELSLFGGYDFAQSLWSHSGIEVSVAAIVAMVSVIAIVLTNEIDGSDYEQYELGLIGFSFLIIPLYVAMPAFQNLVNGSDAIAFVLWILISAGVVYISYTE